MQVFYRRELLPTKCLNAETCANGDAGYGIALLLTSERVLSAPAEFTAETAK